jgi:dihydrofolate reductase
MMYDRSLPENVLHATSLRSAMQSLSTDASTSEKLHHVFIIGGAQLYNKALQDHPEIATRILLTRITKGDDQWKCDTFFPQLEANQWRQCSIQEHREWLDGVEIPEEEVHEGEVAWKYEMWERKL